MRGIEYRVGRRRVSERDLPKGLEKEGTETAAKDLRENFRPSVTPEQVSD